MARRFGVLVGLVVIVSGLAVVPAQAAVNYQVRGTASCPHGSFIVGVTVQSSGGGSGAATMTRFPGSATAARFSRTFSTTLPTTIYLNVGCGGTASAWASTNRTASTAISSGVVFYVNTGCTGTGLCLFYPLENNTPAAPANNPVTNTTLSTRRAADFWRTMTGRYPNWKGAASAWDDNARATGWVISDAPRVNSLFVVQASADYPTGHVGYVADVRIAGGLLQIKVYDRDFNFQGTDRNAAWIAFSPSMRFIVPPNRSGENR